LGRKNQKKKKKRKKLATLPLVTPFEEKPEHTQGGKSRRKKGKGKCLERRLPQR